ncbi:hypothetical protein KSF78_0003962 [Schistosoma japonicum]|nr:hypothetical protein KSF78_0003962 [Schistosoma japonicum]
MTVKTTQLKKTSDCGEFKIILCSFRFIKRKTKSGRISLDTFEVSNFPHVNINDKLNFFIDNHKTQSKWNRTQQLSSQQISKSKRSKNILAINTYRSEFLNNEEDRALFAKQRSIIYQLNEIMRKSEKADYETFMNLNNTN